jgi:hypothetical protein
VLYACERAAKTLWVRKYSLLVQLGDCARGDEVRNKDQRAFFTSVAFNFSGMSCEL